MLYCAMLLHLYGSLKHEIDRNKLNIMHKFWLIRKILKLT